MTANTNLFVPFGTVL